MSHEMVQISRYKSVKQVVSKPELTQGTGATITLKEKKNAK